MKQPDWSTAPEGATHYLPQKGGFAGRFYRLDTTPLRVDFCEGAGWEVSGNDPEGAWLEDLVARPTAPQWNGEGLPPVGVVCEYSFGGDTWHECQVRHVLDNDPSPDADGWQAVVWCPHLEKEQVARLPLFKFRPIRTPEQIATEERVAAINWMEIDAGVCATAFDGDPEVRVWVENLIDKGWRKAGISE